mmetsp:Transcript_21377/g.43013  ORF Transcript_21377/g.43013 Transcript_21377/m.43013 type:complete len:209 (+) Transcript_21377:828-1454(+)
MSVPFKVHNLLFASTIVTGWSAVGKQLKTASSMRRRRSSSALFSRNDKSREKDRSSLKSKLFLPCTNLSMSGMETVSAGIISNSACLAGWTSSSKSCGTETKTGVEGTSPGLNKTCSHGNSGKAPLLTPQALIAARRRNWASSSGVSTETRTSTPMCFIVVSTRSKRPCPISTSASHWRPIRRRKDCTSLASNPWSTSEATPCSASCR